MLVVVVIVIVDDVVSVLLDAYRKKGESPVVLLPLQPCQPLIFVSLFSLDFHYFEFITFHPR